MSTQPITVKSLIVPTRSQEADPMAIRWAFNATVREKLLEGSECNRAVLPYASWFEVQTFNTRRENHSTDDTQPREMVVTIPAAKVQEYLESALAGKNPNINVPNLGLQIGFVGEMDTAKMAVISATVLPDLPTIRAICRDLKVPSPIGEVCEGQDDLDFGERQTCPTCWLKWLESDALAQYGSHIAGAGVPVIEEDAQGNREQRLVYPEIKELELARDLMHDSLRIGLIALQTDWANISKELDDGARKDIKPYQHGIRKDLHQVKPQDKQLQIVKQYAQASAVPVNDVNAQVQLQTLQLLDRMDQRMAKLEEAQNKQAFAEKMAAAKQAKKAEKENESDENNLGNG